VGGGGCFLMRDARFTHSQRLLGGCGEITIIGLVLARDATEVEGSKGQA